MKKIRKIAIALLGASCLAAATLAFTGCGYCQHKLAEIPKIPSTCTEQGERTSYECEKCGKTFGYSDEKGLYEIKEREPAPLGKHTISDEFSGAVEDGKFKIYNKCSVCENVVEVDEGTLFPFAPSDVDNGKHTRLEGVAATEYTFKAGTAAGSVNIARANSDSNSDPFVNAEIPFTAETPRYVVMFAYNSSDMDVDVIYGSENSGLRCQSEKTTVPAGEYAVIPFTILDKVSGTRCWHEIYMMTALDRDVTLTFCGYYYDTGKPQTVALKATGKTQFESGDKLDKENIALFAYYDSGARRIVTADEIKCDLFDRPLTMDDKEVVLEYGGKQFSYEIAVHDSRRTLTLIGAKFSDGTSSRLLAKNSPMPSDIVRKTGEIFLYWEDMYGNHYTDKEFTLSNGDTTLKAVYYGETKSENYALGKTCTASEEGFNPSGFGIGKLTDGVYSNFNAWGSNAHGSADETVWVQVDLEEVKTINEVDLFKRSDGAYYPRGYYIEVSEDGENYTRVFTLEYDEKARDNEDMKRSCFFEEISARYVRITATELTNGGGGSYYLDFAEIEVYHV